MGRKAAGRKQSLARVLPPFRGGRLLRCHHGTALCDADTLVFFAVFPFSDDPVDVKRVIYSAKLSLSHPFSRINWIDQWAKS